MAIYYIGNGWSHGFFAFDSGHFVVDVELNKAYNTTDPVEAQRCIELARTEGRVVHALELQRVPNCEGLTYRLVKVDISECARARRVAAIKSKLTAEELHELREDFARDANRGVVPHGK